MVTNNNVILSAPDIPETMCAAQGRDFGKADEMISVESNVRVPQLADLNNTKSHVLIKTQAVALAPGDCRVLSGVTRELQGPPSFPYIPGGDVCGTVVETRVDSPYALGDVVAARFDEAPRGAMGEYALVSTNVCGKVPSSVSPVEAAALASATPATLFAEDIRPGERVLILGAGGGQGSHLCQLVRNKGASFVVGVSKDPSRLLAEPILCDQAIDYTKQDVFGMQAFQKEPFDTVIDLAAGAWPKIVDRAKLQEPLIVKTAAQSGRFWTPTPDTATFEAHGIFQILNIFLWPSLYRAISSRLWNRWRLPKFTYTMGLPSKSDVVSRTLAMADKGELKAVTEKPFDFTTDAVRKAFNLQESRHAKGKVVVQIASSDDKK